MSNQVHWMIPCMADSMIIFNYLVSEGRWWLPPQSAITFDDHLPCQIRKSRAMFSSHLKSKINLCSFLQCLTCLYQQSMFALLMSLRGTIPSFTSRVLEYTQATSSVGGLYIHQIIVLPFLWSHSRLVIVIGQVSLGCCNTNTPLTWQHYMHLRFL